jgi:hypothetical protein
MSRGVVTLFTTSALLLGFSGIWSGSRIIRKANGGFIQNHLDSFVRNRAALDAHQTNTEEHFEALSYSQQGGMVKKDTMSMVAEKDEVKEVAKARDGQRARVKKKRRATSRNVTKVHNYNVSLLQKKVLEARASLLNKNHVKAETNDTLPVESPKSRLKAGEVESANATKATSSKTEKVEKTDTVKPLTKQQTTNLRPKAIVTKERNIKRETKASIQQRNSSSPIAEPGKVALGGKTQHGAKNESFTVLKLANDTVTTNATDVDVKNTTRAIVSLTQKKAVNDLKARLRRPHFLLQKPTHHACDGYKGVLLIQSGDQGAAAGTAFFQYVINQIIYAEMFGYLPWVHFNNVSQHVYDPLVHGGANTTVQGIDGMEISWMQVDAPNKTKLEGMVYPGRPRSTGKLDKRSFAVSGTGVFESYFEPISEFRKGDKSCERLPIITMSYDQLRGMHLYSPWAVRTWQYLAMPPQNFVAENQTLHQWFDPMRRKAHEIVKKYYRFQPEIIANVDKILPENETCLGMHIRHSDKWGARRQIPEEEFLPYVKTFIQRGGRTVYLATDSQNVIDTVRKSWPAWVKEHIRTQGDDSVVRSTYQMPVFKIGEHHRTNTEVLNDILALSRCRFMIHGLSAVSESAIYLNLNLHNRSVNLEDPSHMNTVTFGSMVRQDLKSKKVKP